MVRNILNQSGIKVYTNTLDNGEATEIIQVGATTQTKCNVSFKSNTTEDTTPTPSDLLLTADASTGKILKYGTIRNVINSHIWKDVAKNEGQTGDNIVLVDSTNDNVVIGPDGTNNANDRRLLVVGSSGQVGIEVFKGGIFRDGNVTLLADSNLLLESNNSIVYIFSPNTSLTGNRTINLPLLSNDATMIVDETNVGLKLKNNLIVQSDSKSNRYLLDATSATTIVLGNTTDELQLQSKATGVKLMPNILIDSTGNNLISLVSSNYSVGSGTSGYMSLNSGAVRLGNDQLSDSGGGSFINKNSTLITLGNISNTLVLDSLATGVQVAKGLLFTGANNNLISTVGSVTNVGYASNSYTQLSGGHVRLGSDKLYDSGGVNLLSKSGTAITIGSAGITTTIDGTFQSTDIAFLNVASGASKKLYYTFSGSATEYDFLKITRDATTDADSIINVGNTTHQVKFNANDDAGITINTQGGIKAPSGKNMIKYVESLGTYSNTVGNGFDDISIEGLDMTFAATSLASPTQFLIANSTGVIFGAQNELLTLRASLTSGIRLESFLKNSNNRTQLEYDAVNTTNIYGTRSTDKSTLQGTSVDVISSGDIDFFTTASHLFDTYNIKIDGTGNLVFNNHYADGGISQAIKSRAGNTIIGINDAQNTIDVGHTSTQTNIFSSDAVNLYQNGGTTNITQFSNGEIKLIKSTGGDIFGDRPTSSSFTTKERCGNIHCRNVFADNHIYMSYGYWRSFDNGDNSFVVLETYYAGGGGQERDTIRFGTTFDTDIYLSSSNQNKRYALQNNGEIKIYDDSGNQEYIFDRTYIGSERRLKQNIVELDKSNSLNIINNLKPSSYEYKARPTERLTGFIVDEVEGILDEMVFGSTGKDKDGNETGTIKNISKPVLIPTLVSAIQKLNDEINDLKEILKKNNLS